MRLFAVFLLLLLAVTAVAQSNTYCRGDRECATEVRCADGRSPVCKKDYDVPLGECRCPDSQLYMKKING
uniref:TIL domain-containing protein n=1 Tax=Bursaphelenchus xylophilus TaxID=6326 RepID=A0A1I7SH73_BURXY